jgi:hypothetical protein
VHPLDVRVVQLARGYPVSFRCFGNQRPFVKHSR